MGPGYVAGLATSASNGGVIRGSSISTPLSSTARGFWFSLSFQALQARVSVSASASGNGSPPKSFDFDLMIIVALIGGHGYMDFEFLVPNDARLRADISQRSNLRYVKIALEHFDDQQRTDFRNSCLWFLSEVPDLQFSAQLIQQFVFCCIQTDKAHELWFNVQGHLAKFCLQKRLIRGFRGSLGRKFADAKQKKEKAVTYTIHGFPTTMQIWAFKTMPKIGDRDSIAPQFQLEPSDDGGNVGNETKKVEEFSGGGSKDDEELGDGEDEVDGEEIGGDESGDGNGEDFDDGDSGDSVSTLAYGATAGASLTRTKVEEMLLDQRTLIKILLHTVKFEIIQHVTNEFVRLREFISTLVPSSSSTTTAPTVDTENEPRVVGSLPHDGNGDETDLDPECAKSQVHARDFDPLSDDHDKDMGIETQEDNGGCGMDLEPRMNGDGDVVAFDGLENRDDEPVASASGVAEATIPVLDNDLPTTMRKRSARVRRPAASARTSYTRGRAKRVKK
ncbi:Hypothetical predicted protein [Olea europaea subsp. europaea]|uniref:Uncharacterized protein n=1 Tax=Olea europaea subsp. europaea TaxID=158383 RepID=A0A8S0VGN4_OLEEU|nr:Hypothetical predicted protein [Olea europaea subsp. europaea]